MKKRYALPLLLIAPSLHAGLRAQVGSLDPDFANAGLGIYAPGSLHDIGHGITTLPDTTMYVCGVAWSGGSPAGFVTHVLQDGTIDVGFGTNGYTFFDAGEEAYLYDLVVAADGSIFACGTAYPTFAQQTMLLVHLSMDGVPDMGFGSGGMVTTVVGNVDSEAQSMVMDALGRITVAGRAGFGSESNALIARYTPNGLLDANFSSDGFYLYAGNADEDAFHAIDVLSDGSVVAAGSFVQNFAYRSMVIRVDDSGAPVTTFGTGGMAALDLAGNVDDAWGILADGLECLVTGYQLTTQNDQDVYVTRLDANGGPVISFGTNGTTVINTNVNEIGYDIAQHPDGTILVCGSSGVAGFAAPRDMLLACLLGDGTLDASFGNGGTVITSVQPDFDDANAVAVQVDGKVVTTGFTSGFSAGTDNDLVIARYLKEEASSIASTTDLLGSVALFPNPTGSASVTLLGLPSQQDIQVEFIDASGRMVASERIIQAIEQRHTLATNDLSAGAYHVHIRTHNSTRVLPLVVTR